MSISVIPHTPRVCVLMACYNSAKYIIPAIESIVNQTFDDFEFIIVDDGSTDETVEIIRSFKDCRIRLIAEAGSEKQNKGLTIRLNEGLACTQSQLIARMDADDVSYQDRLLLQVGAFDQDPELTMISGGADIIDSAGRKVGEALPSTYGQAPLDYLRGNTSPYIHSTVMFRRQTISSCGNYDAELRVGQDYDLWLRLAEAGNKIEVLPDKLIQFRRHSNSLSASGLGKWETNVLICARAALRQRGLNMEINELRKFSQNSRPATNYARSIRIRRNLRDLLYGLRRSSMPIKSPVLFDILRDLHFLLFPVSLESARDAMVEAILGKMSAQTPRAGEQ